MFSLFFLLKYTTVIGYIITVTSTVVKKTALNVSRTASSEETSGSFEYAKRREGVLLDCLVTMVNFSNYILSF